MLRKLDDIETEIQQISRALSQISHDHPDLPFFVAGLGRCYKDRFDLRNEPGDIDKAIEYTAIALKWTPADNPYLPSLLINLGCLHNGRLHRLGEANDSHKAIECATYALSLTPDGHPELPQRLANLGTFHIGRFEHLGELDDLEKGIKYTARAVALSSKDDPDILPLLGNLGMCHSFRFDRLGDLIDLEKAIECHSHALALTPNDHPDISRRLSLLGNSHSRRFQHLGELNELEKAIDYESRGLTLTPENHPELVDRLGNLAVSHQSRYRHLGDLGDLDKAIEYTSRARTLTPNGHPYLPKHLTHLAVFHNYRYKHLGEVSDLEKAIRYQTRGIELTPQNHPSLSGLTACLGALFKTRYERLGELEDLDNAINSGHDAIMLAPKDHQNLPDWLITLAWSHHHRYKRLGEQSDVERAFECMSHAISLTPDGHPHFPMRHFPLAMMHYEQHTRTNNPFHLREALAAFRMASRPLNESLPGKTGNDCVWERVASKQGPVSVAEGYQASMSLLPLFRWLKIKPDKKYDDAELTKGLNFPANAAFAAIRSSEFKLALECLEHTRCIFWNERLMVRLPLDQLESSHPALAARLQEVTNHMSNASSDSESGALTAEQMAYRHHKLMEDYDALLFQARTLCHFGNLIQPKAANELIRAAKYGPVVVLNCHPDSCDALLIIPGQDDIHHVPLPDFSGEKASRATLEMYKSLARKGIRERGVRVRQDPEQKDGMKTILAALWNDIVKPILDFLGYLGDVPAGNLPHITWCPTGHLSFLPLHAAGNYDQPAQRAFNYVVSSYTPTLTTLLSSVPNSLESGSRVLAIGLESTPGHSALAGAAEELTCVRAHLQNTAGYTELVNDQAKVTTVLDAMEEHDWIHLACHASQSFVDPSLGGFFLHDGILGMANIIHNRRTFKRRGLAYLSACQTATGMENLPDEAVHLASGMLTAGYSSVIATMWSVKDKDAPFVADKVYGRLLKDRWVGNGEAGKALHYAVDALREKVGEEAFERWVPFIHIGS